MKFVRLVILITALVSAIAAYAQENPYRIAEGWPQLSAGTTWGAVISVDSDAQGNIWVFHRNDPTILEFAPSGRLIKSFGAGMFVQPHGLTVDRDGNIWVTDQSAKDGKGEQAIKFSPEGQVLMTLGKAGVAGSGTDAFNGPCDVAVAANGDVFVAD